MKVSGWMPPMSVYSHAKTYEYSLKTWINCSSCELSNATLIFKVFPRRISTFFLPNSKIEKMGNVDIKAESSSSEVCVSWNFVLVGGLSKCETKRKIAPQNTKENMGLKYNG